MLPEDDLLDVDGTLEPEMDEIDEVLAALRSLIEKVSSPVVRACLEEAYESVEHLAGRDPGLAESA